MEQKRLEWKVGLFVFVGLALIALLLLQFSKGANIFRSTYELQLQAGNVGGLKKRAGVLLAGVQVGQVDEIKLAGDGKSVTIFLKIYEGNKIYSDARFAIEQSGVLGDQYIAIIPVLNQEPLLKNSDVVHCDVPFNLQEVMRNAAGFITRIDDTAKRLNEAIDDVRRLVLNEQTLTNLAASIGTLRGASERAFTVVDNINGIVETNRISVANVMSNLVYFSEQANGLASQLGTVLNTNSVELNAMMKNLSASSADLKSLLDEAQAGKGLAGTVLKNEEFSSNVSAIAQNLSITSSNLNQLGLWRVLFPKHPKPAAK
ncbi:MAG: MlaD family protein [Verrucomicrobiota bacterium]